MGSGDSSERDRVALGATTDGTDDTVVAGAAGAATGGRRGSRDELAATVSSDPSTASAERPLARGPELPATLPRGAQLGRYLVVETLGSGAMGVVYAAYDPELDRKLAIKVMRPAAGRELGATGARARLLREAQAMAKLAHPNVIAVFDVGTLGAEVFVAMELVEGSTLRQWLAAQPRAWREIVDAFTQAGRGLAAAHAAGLVHRDFKPDNVLVGRDGRVRVLDFGLARALDDEQPAAAPATPAAPALRPSEPLLGSPLTHTGAVLGTPLYMSPEQWDHAATDARSDQFSFCVALYEALWRQPPFPGANIVELGEAVRAHRLVSPPASSELPTRVQDTVLRGLARVPADRFASMDELLAALAEPARAHRPWRVWAVAAGLGCVALAATALAIRRGPADDVCGGARAELRGVWDGPRREAIGQAFAASGASFQAATWQRASAAVDRYTDAWVAMHDQACRATRVRGEQSEHMLDLRMACLAQRRSGLAAQLEVLAHPDKDIVSHAVTALQQLASIDDCADLPALTAATPPPADPAARARLAVLEGTLGSAKALTRAGRLAPARDALTALIADARTLGYAPFTGEVLFELADVQAKLGDGAAGGATLHEAVLAAEAGGDRTLAARIWTHLVFVAGQAGRYDEAASAGRHAEALLAQAGSPADRATLEIELGNLASLQGKNDDALAHLQTALAAREKLFGRDAAEVGVVLDDLGIVLVALGRSEEALAVHQRGLAIAEATLGPDHPDTATSVSSVGVALHTLHRDEEALVYHRRALAILEKALGPTHPEVGSTHTFLGDSLLALHRVPEALAEYRQALAIEEAALGPEHVNLAYDLLGLADVELGTDDVAGALAHAERALRLREAHAGAPTELAEARYMVARALARTGKELPRALALATQARAGYAADPAHAEDLAAVDRWLAKHRPPR